MTGATAKALAAKRKAAELATKHAAKLAKIEHAMVGVAALGLVTGVHLFELVASGALVAIEGTFMLAATEA